MRLIFHQCSGGSSGRFNGGAGDSEAGGGSSGGAGGGESRVGPGHVKSRNARHKRKRTDVQTAEGGATADG